MTQPGDRKPYVIRGFRVECSNLDTFNKANDEIAAWMESASADGYSLVSISDVPANAVFVYCRVTMKLTTPQGNPLRAH